MALVPSLQRWAGVALSTGGVLTFLLNALLTPWLPEHRPMGETAALSIFAWRQGVSAVAVACLLFGSIGIFLAQSGRRSRWGGIWFVVSFVGTTLVFGNEWCDVFVLRTLALRSPGSLQPLESSAGFSLYDLGAMIALGIFTIGWIGFAAWTSRGTELDRRGAILVLAGLVLLPLLGAVLHRWGFVLGNVVLGGGWYWWGLDIRRRAFRRAVVNTTASSLASS